MTTTVNRLDALRAGYGRARKAFDARARRERLLLIGAAIAVAWLLADHFSVTPAFKQWSAARSRQASAASELARLNQDIVQRGESARGAEQQLRAEVAQLNVRLAQGDAALRAVSSTLVGAHEMLPMLDRLLARNGGLHLRSMLSLPRGEVSPAPASAAASAPADSRSTPALYRQGVELVVEGSYAEILAYVRAIEAMPQRVLWGGLQLKTLEYPKVALTLRLYTLSPDRNWLEI